MSSYPGLGAAGQEYIQEEEYKALYGYPNGKVNSSLLAEVPGTSRPFILTNQLYSQTIPIPTPFDLGSTGPVIVGATTYGGSKQSSSSTPYLVRYNTVTLSNTNLAQSSDGGGLTYWFVGANFANAGSQALQVTYNILNQGIPTNLDPNAGYQAAVFVDGNAYNFGNAQYPWTYNVNSGIVLFTGSAVYPGSGSPFNNLPMPTSDVTMTFWRYEGAIGAPGVWGLTGNNIYNTNTSGNVGINTSNPVYTLEVDGTLGVIGGDSGTITIANTTTSVVGGATGTSSIQQYNGSLTIKNNTDSASMYLISKSNGGIEIDGAGNVIASNYYVNGGVTYFRAAVPSGWTATGVSQGGTNGSEFYINNQAGGGLHYQVSGTEYFLIDGSGNVGIGTGTPSYKLEVDGTLGVTDPYYSTITLNSVGGSATISQGAIGATSSALTISNNTAGGYLYMGTVGGLMTMDNSGNVGIGTGATASYKLNVFGPISATSTIYSRSGLDGYATIHPGGSSTSGYVEIFLSNAAPDPYQGTRAGYIGNVNIDLSQVPPLVGWMLYAAEGLCQGSQFIGPSTGNVNIQSGSISASGTISATGYMYAATPTTYPDNSTKVATTAYVATAIASVPVSTNYWTSNGTNGIYNNGSYVSIGSLGVNTAGTLYVGGTIMASSRIASSPDYLLQGIVNLAPGSTNTSGYVEFWSANSGYPDVTYRLGYIGYATNTSYLLLAAGSAAGYQFQGPSGGTVTVATGSINASGTITAVAITATSDYRIKEDIKPLQLADYSVDNLNPVTFKFKKDGKESIGLIAHELQEYFPFLVEGEKDGETTQSVNYIGLIGVLIKEIQELKARVKELENKT